MEETEPDDEEEDLEEGEERLNKKRRRLSTLKGEYVNFKQGVYKGSPYTKFEEFLPCHS